MRKLYKIARIVNLELDKLAIPILSDEKIAPYFEEMARRQNKTAS